jgi:hypothetical protein
LCEISRIYLRSLDKLPYSGVLNYHILEIESHSFSLKVHHTLDRRLYVIECEVLHSDRLWGGRKDHVEEIPCC